MKSRKYFEKLGYSMQAFSNPADNYMRILNISYPKSEADASKIDEFINNYEAKIMWKIDV